MPPEGKTAPAGLVEKEQHDEEPSNRGAASSPLPAVLDAYTPSGRQKFPLSPLTLPVSIHPLDASSPTTSSADEDEFPHPSQLTQMVRAMRQTPKPKPKTQRDTTDREDPPIEMLNDVEGDDSTLNLYEALSVNGTNRYHPLRLLRAQNKNSFQSSNINPEFASSDPSKHTTATHTRCRKHLWMPANEPDDDRSLNTIRAAPLAEPQAENYRGDPQSLEYDFLIAPEFLKHECLTDYLSSPSDVSPIQSSPSSSLFGSPIMKTMDSNNESGWVITDDDINIRNDQPQHINNDASEPASNDQDTPTSHNSASPPTSASGSESRNLYPTSRPFDNVTINTSACKAPSLFKIVNDTRQYLTLKVSVPLDALTRPWNDTF
ncbi:hypothetical protein GG344DRAFT_80890 [Lentinula edodes]|nr:hypothetical protein GG344DRAFT_80890 [Lentinula edodes]